MLGSPCQKQLAEGTATTDRWMDGRMDGWMDEGRLSNNKMHVRRSESLNFGVSLRVVIWVVNYICNNFVQHYQLAKYLILCYSVAYIYLQFHYIIVGK